VRGELELGKQIAFLGVAAILLGGCSLGSQSEIIGLDGRTLSAQESEAVRQTCSRAGDRWCLTARGYAMVSRDDGAAARANLVQNAENNRREQKAVARAKEEARKKQIEQASRNKKKVAGSDPAPASSNGVPARANAAPAPKLLYDNVLCRHLALKGGGCPASLGMN
jgi:hypothetical protein